jgi:hypothetical protein
MHYANLFVAAYLIWPQGFDGFLLSRVVEFADIVDPGAKGFGVFFWDH